MKKRIIKIIAWVLLAAFIAQDIAWAIPQEGNGVPSQSTLGVPTIFQGIRTGTDIKAMEATLVCILQMIGQDGIEKFHYNLPLEVAGVKFNLRFDKMSKKHDTIIIPCSISKRGYFEALISANGSVSIVKYGESRDTEQKYFRIGSFFIAAEKTSLNAPYRKNDLFEVLNKDRTTGSRFEIPHMGLWASLYDKVDNKFIIAHIAKEDGGFRALQDYFVLRLDIKPTLTMESERLLYYPREGADPIHVVVPATAERQLDAAFHENGLIGFIKSVLAGARLIFYFDNLLMKQHGRFSVWLTDPDKSDANAIMTIARLVLPESSLSNSLVFERHKPWARIADLIVLDKKNKNALIAEFGRHKTSVQASKIASSLRAFLKLNREKGSGIKFLPKRITLYADGIETNAKLYYHFSVEQQRAIASFIHTYPDLGISNIIMRSFLKKVQMVINNIVADLAGEDEILKQLPNRFVYIVDNAISVDRDNTKKRAVVLIFRKKDNNNYVVEKKGFDILPLFNSTQELLENYNRTLQMINDLQQKNQGSEVSSLSIAEINADIDRIQQANIKVTIFKEDGSISRVMEPEDFVPAARARIGIMPKKVDGQIRWFEAPYSGGINLPLSVSAPVAKIVKEPVLKISRHKTAIKHTKLLGQDQKSKVELVTFEDGSKAIKKSLDKLLGSRRLARWLIRRQFEVLLALQGINGIPEIIGTFDEKENAFYYHYIEGDRIDRVPHIDDELFNKLYAIFQDMWRIGLVHGSFCKRNMLVGNDGQPYVIDFETAIWKESGFLLRWLFNIFQREDLYHLYKLKLQFKPSLVTSEERNIGSHSSWLRTIYNSVYFKPYKSISKLLRKFNSAIRQGIAPVTPLLDSTRDKIAAQAAQNTDIAKTETTAVRFTDKPLESPPDSGPSTRFYKTPKDRLSSTNNAQAPHSFNQSLYKEIKHFTENYRQNLEQALRKELMESDRVFASSGLERALQERLDYFDKILKINASNHLNGADDSAIIDLAQEALAKSTLDEIEDIKEYTESLQIKKIIEDLKNMDEIPDFKFHIHDQVVSSLGNIDSRSLAFETLLNAGLKTKAESLRELLSPIGDDDGTVIRALEDYAEGQSLEYNFFKARRVFLAPIKKEYGSVAVDKALLQMDREIIEDGRSSKANQFQPIWPEIYRILQEPEDPAIDLSKEDESPGISYGVNLFSRLLSGKVHLDKVPSILEKEELVNEIKSFANLTKQEDLVIYLIYSEGRTVKEVKGIMGITEKRIYQLRKRALEKLRTAAESMGEPAANTPQNKINKTKKIEGIQPAQFLRDIVNPEELTQNMIEGILSALFSNKKLTLAFSKKLKGLESAQLKALVGQLSQWKESTARKNKRMKTLLDNFTVLEYDDLKAALDDKNIDVNAADGLILTYAPKPKDESQNPANIGSAIKPVYIVEEEGGFPANYYYPLLEMVTVSLARELLHWDESQLREALAASNITADTFGIDTVIDEKLGILIFKVLPRMERYNNSDRVDRYTRLLQFLHSA